MSPTARAIAGERVSARVGLGVMAFFAVAVSLVALLAYGLQPIGAATDPELAAGFREHPALLYVHVFPSVVALATGWIQLVRRIRDRWPAAHRWVGRVYFGAIGIGGGSGLALAWFAYGGWITKLGFACLAVGWLVTSALALRAIRRRDVVTHRRWAIRSVALTYAAVTLRIYIPAALVSGQALGDVYPAIAWLAWVPNLTVAELFLRRARAARADAITA